MELVNAGRPSASPTAWPRIPEERPALLRLASKAYGIAL
jgi:hypothetical protein